MKTQFKNVIQLLDYFKDDATCKALLAQQRWSGKPVCPHCKGDRVYVTARGYRCADKACAKKFSVLHGTIFENSKIKLRYWFAAIYLVTAHKKGISSHQLARDLGVTQKTGWFMLGRIREMLKDNAPELLTGVVEIDESYWGAKEANKHANKRVGKTEGRSTATKTPILGILQRGGKVVVKAVVNVKKESLLPIMVQNVAPGTTICTDEFNAYRSLKKAYDHHVIKHVDKEYVRGPVHTNTIEGFWSLLKRGLHGVYHSVTPKHLDRYCTEFAYRYNTRHQSDNDRFFETLTKSANFTLTYKELTK